MFGGPYSKVWGRSGSESGPPLILSLLLVLRSKPSPKPSTQFFHGCRLFARRLTQEVSLIPLGHADIKFRVQGLGCGFLASGSALNPKPYGLGCRDNRDLIKRAADQGLLSVIGGFSTFWLLFRGFL